MAGLILSHILMSGIPNMNHLSPLNISLLIGFEIGVILPGLLGITEHKSNSLLVSHFLLAPLTDNQKKQ